MNPAIANIMQQMSKQSSWNDSSLTGRGYLGLALGAGEGLVLGSGVGIGLRVKG